ncbi:hypothetical protein ASZ90_004800 [hydrocarbon metagenome]|uniref:Uncharacterized protein n=1 Tax=hydrocarbon metagenome TaxID=938273 RepID=A0A0W8FWZ9_9ZZZZ
MFSLPKNSLTSDRNTSDGLGIINGETIPKEKMMNHKIKRVIGPISGKYLTLLPLV